MNLGRSTENPGNGGPPKSFVKAFGPQSTNLAVWKVMGRELSPIYHIHSNLPPVLIIHGGADTLTPLDQSERFQAEGRRAGCAVELIVRPGKKHGWTTMIWDVRRFADWFDHFLRPPVGSSSSGEHTRPRVFRPAPAPVGPSSSGRHTLQSRGLRAPLPREIKSRGTSPREIFSADPELGSAAAISRGSPHEIICWAPNPASAASISRG